jgi:hypothetical protein
MIISGPGLIGTSISPHQCSRFRSSPEFSATSDANFGIEGALQILDSGAALKLKFQ